MVTRAGPLAGFAASCLLGLVALPATLGVPPRGGEAAIVDARWLEVAWFVGAAIVSVCLLAFAPGVVDLVRRSLPSDVEHRTSTDAVARLLVALGYVALIQAIARQPLVLVLGASAEPFLIELALGSASFVLALGVLAGVHRAATPLLEQRCLVTLHALVPTTGSDATLAEAAAWDAEQPHHTQSALDPSRRPSEQPTRLARDPAATEPSAGRRQA